MEQNQLQLFDNSAIKVQTFNICTSKGILKTINKFLGNNKELLLLRYTYSGTGSRFYVVIQYRYL